MADEDREHDGPSLELPSFGLRRKRRARTAATHERPTEPIAAQPPVTEPPVTEPPVTEPEPPAVEPEPPLVEPEPTPATQARPRVAEEAPVPARTGHRPVATGAPVGHDSSNNAGDDPADEAGHGPQETSERRRGPALPAIGGMPASIVTGLLVGVITVGLTWASQRLCEVTRGTSSCGGPGFLLLVAILIAMVLLGGALLRAWAVPDPTSTSFLAVGLLAVVTLLFLVDVLFSWWMIIVIPLIAMGTFALSHWVTTALVEPDER